MTENTPEKNAPGGAPGEAPGKSGETAKKKTPEPSGVDLARVALRAAKEQARARGDAAQQKKQARRGGACAPARAPTGATPWRSAPPSTGC